MSAEPTLLIGRCSFWPESRDPEAWLRALVALAPAAEKSGTQSWTSPRAVGNTVLRGRLSRRGVTGLFGLAPAKPSVAADVRRLTSSVQPPDTLSLPTLLGVGLLELPSHPSPESHPPAWQLSKQAHALLTAWQTGDHRHGLEQLATLLLSRSVWLRLALLKLHMGHWQLCQWDKLKASNGQLRVGKTLLLGNDADPAAWPSGIEEPVLGAWWPELLAESPVTVQIHAPKTANPDDGLSLSPLKSPLYLLDSLGWLDATGRLRLPSELAHERLLSSLVGPKPSATALLNQTTAAFGDHRGAFPLEAVMLRFAHDSGVFPSPAANDSAWIDWTDRVLSEAFRTGVIELFSAEPGQPRHGRGLFGDSAQQLLRWHVHPGFDDLHHSVSSAFTPEPSPVTNS